MSIHFFWGRLKQIKGVAASTALQHVWHRNLKWATLSLRWNFAKSSLRSTRSVPRAIKELLQQQSAAVTMVLTLWVGALLPQCVLLQRTWQAILWRRSHSTGTRSKWRSSVQTRTRGKQRSLSVPRIWEPIVSVVVPKRFNVLRPNLTTTLWQSRTRLHKLSMLLSHVHVATRAKQ